MPPMLPPKSCHASVAGTGRPTSGGLFAQNASPLKAEKQPPSVAWQDPLPFPENDTWHACFAQSMTTRVRDAANGKRYVCRLLACRGPEEVEFLVKETYRIQV